MIQAAANKDGHWTDAITWNNQIAWSYKDKPPKYLICFYTFQRWSPVTSWWLQSLLVMSSQEWRRGITGLVNVSHTYSWPFASLWNSTTYKFACSNLFHMCSLAINPPVASFCASMCLCVQCAARPKRQHLSGRVGGFTGSMVGSCREMDNHRHGLWVNINQTRGRLGTWTSQQLD